MKPGLLWVLCVPLLVQAQSPSGVTVIDREGGLVSDLVAGVPFGLRVNGTGLTSNDRVRIVSGAVQCGNSGSEQSAADLVGVPLAGGVPGQDVLHAAGAVGPLNNTALEQQWSGLVLARTGQYRVCYCLASSPPCDAGSKFQAELGVLQVTGPAGGYNFSCPVGWPCEVGPFAGNVSAGNQLRLMASCNPPVGAGGFLPGSELYANASDGLENDPMVSDALLGGSRTFSWGSSAVQGMGHRYEVCWCAGGQSANCTQAEDFLVPVGHLDVPGPTRPVSILCSAGRQCHLHLPTLYGVGLGNGDRVLVSQVCGASDAAVSGWPNEGISDPADEGGQYFQWTASDLANSTSLNGTFVAQPGMYRLCWCHRDAPCGNSSDFRMDIGSVAFAGPSGSQSWVCTRGQQCTLSDILGTALSVDDRYLVQRSCGGLDSEGGFEGGPALPDSVQPSPSLSGTAASVSWSRVATAVGEYELCWAAAWQRPSNRSCSDLSWDGQAAGLASVCASTSLGDGRCDLLSAEAARLRCGSLGARLCLPHELMQGEAAGTPCAAGSPRYWTAKSCGTLHRATVNAEQGAAGLTCEAESVAVTQFLSQPATNTWACCADEPAAPSPDAATYFSQPPVYASTAGLVTVRGPFTQDASCVSGEACNVRLQGLLLNSTLDRLLILKYARSCGNSSASPATADFQQVLANSTSSSSGSATFDLGRASTFATFQMCWCSMVHSACQNVQDFNVFVGDLLVGGIDRQTTYCIYSLPCTIELHGTNLGQADSIVVSPVGEQCGGRLSSVPEVEVNPTTMLQRPNTTAKAFTVGVISKLDAFQVCYCINFGNRACTSSGAPVYEHFSMPAGIIEVRGPRLNVTLSSARAGVPYRLQLSGRLLNRFNRITVLRAGGPACGTFGSNESDSSVAMASAIPVSVYTDGTQEGWDVTLMRSGDYYVCWCNADPCDNATSFGVLAALLPVDGLLDDRDPEHPPQIVGNPFPLLLRGQNLRSSDRAVIAPRASVAYCGAPDTNRHGSLSQNIEGRAPTVISSSAYQVTSQLWLNSRVAAVGEYLICWCGRTLCTLSSHFNIEAARLNITGPTLGDFTAVTAGQPFRLVVHGTAMTVADRISIVDMSTECGTQPASSLASAVVDSSGTGSIGPSLETSSYVTVWAGLRIRWQGLYKVCWAGNYSSSRLCLATDVSGSCTQFESAYYPYHIGNLRVDYGNISLIGQTRIVRCGSLDVMAVPPQFTPRLTLDYAEWRCEPRESEICESLHYDFLDVTARNRLSLHIPADVISSGLDRARFWASGRGEDASVHNITMSITMIDIENITRRGSLALQIFDQMPLVVGSPSTSRITTDDSLYLAVYVQLPGGDFCDAASAPAMPSGVSVSWSAQPAMTDLTANNTASSPYHLLMEPAAVVDLGIGVHTIIARVTLGSQYAPQDVVLLVDVREGRLPPPGLVSPLAVPDGCPTTFSIAAPAVGVGGDALAYSWTCNGPQGATCTNFSSIGAIKPIHVFDLSSGMSGHHRVSLRVEDSDGGTAEAKAIIDVVAGPLPLAQGRWPVALLPLPEVLGASQPITCAAAALRGNHSLPERCAPPLDAAWSLLNLTDFNVSSADALNEDDLDIMNGTEVSLAMQRVSLVADGYPVVTFMGLVPASMLEPGGQYRCVLRAGDALLGSTTSFRIAAVPQSGWITVAPRRGVALQTQFTLESTGWLAENPPLRHAFFAVPGPPPPAGTAVDAARFLRGFAPESGAMALLGVAGPRVSVVVRIRDALGSSAEASTEIEVAAATGTAAALAALGSAWWPPDPRAVIATAAALVSAISPDAGFADPFNATGQLAQSQAATTGAVVSALLDGLHAAAGPIEGGQLSREDLGLQVWVLERTLQLALGGAGTTPALNASSSLKAAAVLARVAVQSIAAPPEPATAGRFVAAASALVTGAAPLELVEAAEVLRLVRSAERHLGSALHEGMRRGAAPGGRYFARALALQRASTLNMSLVVGWAADAVAASGMDVPAEGLTLRLPALAQRRLSAAGAAPWCAGGDVRVQLTRWPRSPLGPSPLAEQVLFEGSLQGLRAASTAEARGVAEIAGLRLWGCPTAAWQSANIIVSFFPEAGTVSQSFEVDARNGSEIQTSRVEVSWVCAQWDSALGLWRAQPTMTALSNGTAISCSSVLDPNAASAALAEVTDEGYTFLAALPAARSVWLRSVPAELPPPPKVRELFFWRLWGLGTAVLLGQTLLLGLLLFTRPLAAQVRPSEEALVAAKLQRPTLSAKSVTRSLEKLPGNRSRRYCVCVPAFWLWDGLWQVVPWRLLSWSSWSFRRRRISMDVLEGAQIFSAGLPEKSIPSVVLADSELSLSTEPGLRSATLDRAKEAATCARRVQAQRAAFSGLTLEPRCRGVALFDAREHYFRGLLLRALDMYRDLKADADELIQAEKLDALRNGGGRRNSNSSAGFFDGRRRPANAQDAGEDEVLSFAIAHHVQQGILTLALGEEQVDLAKNEKDMLISYQEALRKAMGNKPPLEKPLLLSAFSPPVAVSVQLLSIDSGRDRNSKPGSGIKRGSTTSLRGGSKGGPGVKRGSGSVSTVSWRMGVKGGLKHSASSTSSLKDAMMGSAATGFAGVLPEQRHGRAGASAWEDEPGYAALKSELDMEEQSYIPGAIYLMWLHGRNLHIHRSASTLHDAKAKPQVLDHMLSIYEVTRTYFLGDDVQEFTCAPNDDGTLIMRLRSGLRLRWRVAGEVRAWASTSPGPLAGEVREGCEDIREAIHCDDEAVRLAAESSIFFYRLRRVPHIANSLHLETLVGTSAHAYMWYSHGGAVVSLAFTPNGAALQEEACLPGTAGEEEGHQDLIQVVGFYTSDIAHLEHTVRHIKESVRSTWYQIVLTLRDSRKLRLCFTTRFTRLTCQSSILSMRELVFPSAPEVEVQRYGNFAVEVKEEEDTSPMSEPKAGRLASASPVHDPQDDAPEWRGLSGNLELRVLSASQLGLIEPPCDKLMVAKKAFGGGNPRPPPKPTGRTGLPSPRVYAYVHTQPRPLEPEVRKTRELPERTANPIWNLTWNFTAEYSEGDQPPPDIRLEVWDCGGINEFLGEIIVPFPRGNRVRQYHLRLRPHYSKMAKGETRQVNGTISFQLRWKGAREIEPDSPMLLPIFPSPLHSVCGTLGITLIRGIDLRSADFLSSDPYCVVHVSASPKLVHSARTETRFGTRNPVWDELHEFPINWPVAEFSSAPVVKVELWDYDHFSSDEFLGEASFPLPSNEGSDVLELELVPNRSKGAATVKGHIQVRLHYFDEFHHTSSGLEVRLSKYEQQYCTYFGTRPVDDQLARAMAPSLSFFHFSFGRLLLGQMRRAWHLATCGLVDPGPLRAGGVQARINGYFALSAALWSSVAVASAVLAGWDSAGYGGSLAAGAGVGLLMPDIAHILAQQLWHDPRPPHTVGVEAWASRGKGDHPVFAIVVLLVALCGLAASLVLGDEDADLRITLAAVALLVVRLLVVPALHGLFVATALICFKRSSMFDWIVRYCPSMLTAHSAAL